MGTVVVGCRTKNVAVLGLRLRLFSKTLLTLFHYCQCFGPFHGHFHDPPNMAMNMVGEVPNGPCTLLKRADETRNPKLRDSALAVIYTHKTTTHPSTRHKTQATTTLYIHIHLTYLQNTITPTPTPTPTCSLLKFATRSTNYHLPKR